MVRGPLRMRSSFSELRACRSPRGLRIIRYAVLRYPLAMDIIAVITPVTPAPANNPLAATFAWSS